jgi:hypothetical protein
MSALGPGSRHQKGAGIRPRGETASAISSKPGSENQVIACGYENVNDAERLRHDPAMRWIVKAPQGLAALPSRMGRWSS